MTSQTNMFKDPFTGSEAGDIVLGASQISVNVSSLDIAVSNLNTGVSGLAETVSGLSGVVGEFGTLNEAMSVLSADRSRIFSQDVVLDADNTAVKVPCAVLSGSVEVEKLSVELLSGAITNMTDIHFDLWDQTASTLITKLTDATFSGKAIGTVAVKTGPVADALTVLDASAGAFFEDSVKEVFSKFLLRGKEAAVNHLRLGYATTESPISGTAKVKIQYRPISANGALTEYVAP